MQMADFNTWLGFFFYLVLLNPPPPSFQEQNNCLEQSWFMYYMYIYQYLQYRNFELCQFDLVEDFAIVAEVVIRGQQVCELH